MEPHNICRKVAKTLINFGDVYCFFNTFLKVN